MRYLRTLFTLLLSTILFSCSSSKKFFEKSTARLTKPADIRILINERENTLNLPVEKSIVLYDNNKIIAFVEPGNNLHFFDDEKSIAVSIKDKTFYGDNFQIKARDKNSFINFNGKNFKGKIKIFSTGDSIHAVNILPLEEYLKGVVPAEIPLKNGNSYYQAVKAFAICARSYTIMKMELGNPIYDVHTDVRDQVYGGADKENPISNRAIEETKGLILKYDGKSATVFYSSTCGGHTENSANVFTGDDLPYLRGVVDGNPSYCSISPKYNWQETFSESTIIKLLFSSGYLYDTNFVLDSVYIADRFESGRVDHLVFFIHPFEDGSGITGRSNSTVLLTGNNIRYVLKTSNGQKILESTLFNIKYDKNNHEVIINGKGYGHGVGLCEWGAIGMAERGFDYKKILYHYFPGTSISRYYDAH